MRKTTAEVKPDWSPRGLRWQFDVTINGTRVRRRGFATQEEAEAALAELEQPNLDIQLGAAFVHGSLKIGAVGAVAELLVCTDLLKQGFDVFRSVSTNAACDVIAANREGRLCRIEVKSAVTRNGKTHFKRHRFDQSKHDVLALVFLREYRIEYSVKPSDWFAEEATRPLYRIA